ncbi:MAG: hypothetical protein Cons2KO_10100 [Congregibacter sp.]
MVTFCIFAVTTAATSHASDFERDLPFRRYTTADGLIQSRTTGVVQDENGYFWISSFAGINRFDGETFKSYTVRDGLRQSVIYHLYLDDDGRLWAGDSQGGLTLIENGEFTKTIAPGPYAQGVVRGMLQMGDFLYVASEPGGLHKLPLKDMERGLQPVPDTPERIQRLIRRSGSEMLMLSNNELWSLDIETGSSELLLAEIGYAEGCGNNVYIADLGRRVGRLVSGTDIAWDSRDFGGRVNTIACDGDLVGWVSVDGVGTVSYADPSIHYPIPWTFPAFVDREGVLWISARSGLYRYFGERFKTYPMGEPGFEPEIFAVLPGHDGDYWFGSSAGLLHLTRDGSLSNISDAFGFDQQEVRDIRLSDDGRRLWVAQADGPFLELDLVERSYSLLIEERSVVLMGLERDARGLIWAGSYFGQLHVYDPESRALRTNTLEDPGPIYALDYASDGWLWFAAGNQGLYRIDTLDSSAEPELVVGSDRLGADLYTQVVVRESEGAREVWIGTMENGLFRWQNDKLELVLSPERLDGAVITQVEPVGDGSVVVATTNGAARYQPDTDQLEIYTELNGFTALEGKIHATYREADTLWMGTTRGVTTMDLSIPMEAISSPEAFITRRLVGDEAVSASEQSVVVDQANLRLEFDAVSSRRPDRLEFSYRLLGADEEWSFSGETRSVNYSNLPPGQYQFEVRARIKGTAWSEADAWTFTVPTPFWLTPWFIVCIVVILGLLLYLFVKLRLRAVERLNQRLQEEVDERTASIASGKQELERINQQLSSEILERQRADERREDVEARFHQAYKNAPIGMGLVDKDGRVYDANPHLKRLFWPTSKEADSAPLIDVVVEHDRDRFQGFLDAVARETTDQANMEFDCASHDGKVRKIDFLPSTVRAKNGDLRYIMLLAEDVTERRALTDKLAYQARFDELTGLLNRRAFTEYLDTLDLEKNPDGRPYLLFLDLDRFKVVNDTCGHAAGDQLLKNIAKVISAGVREGDLVARLGGDEFALVLERCDEATALSRAERIRQSIQQLEFRWETEVFRIGASIGLVSLDGDTHDVSELQRLADAACYTAKEEGRNRVHLVHGVADAAHEHRGELRWVQRINHAMENDEFELFGQRLLSLGDREPGKTCIEVLLRLRDRGAERYILPNSFMPAAERFGLNSQLDLWVVRNALAYLAGCSREVQESHSLGLNLCGASLSDAKFSEALLRLVSEANLPRGSITFEITETSVIRRMDEASRLVDELRELGCYISLDDFGSGMSSFGYLKHLNVDSLKIDGEFVRDAISDTMDQLFIKFIVDTAHALDKRVVAEHVESSAILEMVEDMGCDYAQGFVVHKPEPLTNLLLPEMGETLPAAS